MARGRLPDGWTMERVAEAANDPEARLLDLERSVWLRGLDEPVELEPTVIVGFSGGICLVQEQSEGMWYMGQIDETDGSIHCWGQYGGDLENAIAGL
jgi:hypothetical protein